MPKRFTLTLALTLSLVALARPDATAQALPESSQAAILAQLRKAEGRRGTAACVIRDLDSGTVMLSHKPDQPLIPASNMKLLTTAAALQQLGHDYQFTTRVLARGPIHDGVLNGSLCFVGGGDPNISGRFRDGDVTAIFREWARGLKQLGINRVSGDLQYESTQFGGPAFHEGWPQDDQYVRWYCAEVSSLAFNDNCIGIRVLPGKPGQPAKIETIPPTAYVTIVNETTTLAGRKGAEIGILRGRADNVITVRGKVYEQATWGYSVDVAVHKPEAYAATVLAETLAAEGVTIDGKVSPVFLGKDDLQAATPLIEHKSRLIDALKPVNTNSQNLHAEMLFRQTGVHFAGKGTFKTGAAAVGEYLSRHKLMTEGVVIADGSGLARDNRVTAATLSGLLAKVAGTPAFEVYRDSLAVGGESGTLEKRLADASVKGRVFAKTGYISGVRALSGYLFTDTRRYAFSILMNDCVYSRETQDEILKLLARAG